MDDFTFRGQALELFGATAAFGDSMRIGAKIDRHEYELPGGGSVIIGEATYKTTARQVTIVPAPGVEPTPQWRRRILSWLQGGRGEMIVHNDPEVMRIAQFDTDGTWGTRGWPDGQIQLTMTLQPLAYAARETILAADTTDGVAQIMVSAPSALPMGVCAAITCVSGTITDAEMDVGGKRLALTGLSLAAGGVIHYDAGQTLCDAASLEVAGEDGYAYVSAWAQLTAAQGDTLSVTLTGGEGRVALLCRGRWPA